MGDAQRFTDRIHAGELLAKRLHAYAQRQDVIVLALPRGGVPVGYTVAQALDAPLDVIIVRKLGVPGHREYAMGAIASGGWCVLNSDVVSGLRIPAASIEQARHQEDLEIARRERLYRANRPAPDLKGRCVILVDDGLATGATMEVAIHAVRSAHPAQVTVAVPVAAPDARARLAGMVDELVCLSTPEEFYAVGLWYDHFEQTGDAEVIHLLQAAARMHSPIQHRAGPPPTRPEHDTSRDRLKR